MLILEDLLAVSSGSEASHSPRSFRIEASRAYADASQRPRGETGPVYVPRLFASLTTAEPAKDAELLIRSGCFELSIEEVNPTDAEGRRAADALNEKLKREIESRTTDVDRKRTEALHERVHQDWVSYMKSVGVDNPISGAQDREPFASLGRGPTKVNVFGFAYQSDGRPKEKWVVEGAQSVKIEIQRAIDAGSTSIIVGVVEWGPAEWGNATAGAWKDS